MSNLKVRVKSKLWERFKESSDYQIDERGYVLKPEHNLIPEVKFADIERDFRQGSGHELAGDFCAVHSSAALVANTFGIWKCRPQTLQLGGLSDFSRVFFEKKCPTEFGGFPPNLDLLAESQTTVLAVESKLTEHLKRKRPEWQDSYFKACPKYAEVEWWELMQETRQGGLQNLDVAQLIKHYLGLRNQKDYLTRNVILFYLFWEPTNWADYDVFKKHREEIQSFAERIEGTSVSFKAQSYPELWSEWESRPELAEHLTNLRKRYLFAV